MKTGQAVVYVDADGVAHAATVGCVHGASPSGFKVLDLVVDASPTTARTVALVWHGVDVFPGHEHWLLPTEAESPAPAAGDDADDVADDDGAGALIAGAWPPLISLEYQADDFDAEGEPLPTTTPSADEGAESVAEMDQNEPNEPTPDV